LLISNTDAFNPSKKVSAAALYPSSSFLIAASLAGSSVKSGLFLIALSFSSPSFVVFCS